jgi:hypothetical protein
MVSMKTSCGCASVVLDEFVLIANKLPVKSSSPSEALDLTASQKLRVRKLSHMTCSYASTRI